MAFFNEAFYSSQPAASTPPLEPRRAKELDTEIDQTLDDALDFLSSSDVEKLLSSSPRANTPQISRLFETPPSSISYKATSSNAKRKRVDFAPFTSTNWGWAANAGPDMQRENSSAQLLRKLQPSRERSTLRSKSILKATNSWNNEQSSSPEMQSASKSWAQVLDFGLKQLRSDKSGMRLDAWRSMQQFLATSPDINLVEEVGEKHNALLANATRDIVHTGKDKNSGLPNQLPNYALKFMSKFLRLPDVENELSPTAVANLLDVTIEQLRRPDISKNLVRCYMDFFYQQDFSSTIMTSARTRKVIEALHAVGLHQTSSGTIMDQIKVCRKFVDQAPEGMIAAASFWMDILLYGLLSEDLAVFKVAVDGAFDIAVKLGHRTEVSKALQRLLATVVDSETKVTHLQQLEKEMAAKADFASDATKAMLVPKMLSAILMFLRAKGPSAVLGNHFKNLVSVLKPYFMRSAAATTSHAYSAWCWLIIAQTHGGRWPEENRTMLRRPLESMLMKATADLDFQKGTPAYVLSTYLVLLYCSFPPDAASQGLKHKWDLYVSEVIGQMLGRSQSHADLACQIICALLSSNTQWDPHLMVQIRKPWNSPMLRIGDLAHIDSSWIRSHLDSVLRLLDKVFKSPHRSEHSLLVWKALLDALARAGGNEIVATKEAKETVAQITNYLTHLWLPYSRKAKDIVLFGQLLEQLLDEPSGTTKGQRVIFTKKILWKASQGNHFEVATTPSHRSMNSSRQPTSAILHFFNVMTEELVEQCSGAETEQSQEEKLSTLYNIIKRLTYRLCAVEPTLLAKIMFLSNGVRKLIKMARSSDSAGGYSYIIQLCHRDLVFITDLVASSETNGLSSRESLQQAYHHLASMMSDVGCYTNGLSNQLSACYRAILDNAHSELGPAGALICVAEATARNIHQFFRSDDAIHARRACRDSTLLDFAETIVKTAPSSVPMADIRKALERFSISHHQSSTKRTDLCEMHKMSSYVLAFAYEHLLDNEEMTNGLSIFVSTVAKVLRKENVIVLTHLRAMQPGIATVVTDRDGRIFTSNAGSSCADSVHELWDIILGKQLFEQNDKAFMAAFDELIAAGLSSRSSQIVNETVAAWNKTYGRRNNVIYSARTAKALRKLTALDVDLALASSLPPQDDEMPDSPLIIESTESIKQVEDVMVPPTTRPMQQIPRLTVSSTPTRAMRSGRQPPSSTPKSKPKPRHEDSEIQFEPIPSSPLPLPGPDMLTERQKEVAERQRKGAAVLFVEASSPATRRMRQLSADLPDEEEPAVPTPSTPVLASAMDDAILSSSPVVASVKRRESTVRRMPPPENILSVARLEEQDELPSSPPATAQDEPMQQPDASPAALDRQRAEHMIPSTAAGPTQSFNSALSSLITLAESGSTRVQDSFAAQADEDHGTKTADASFVSQSLENSRDAIQRSQLDDSRVTDSQRKKRKRSRTSFASSKRRKANDEFVYNTTDYIRFKPKARFVTPDDVLPVIIVKVPGESTPELLDAQASAEEEDEIQVPTTTKRGRGRARKSQRSLSSGQSQASQVNVLPKKRGHSSLRSQDMEVVAGTKGIAEMDKDRKRSKVGPKTPSFRERSASSHYVEVTPGDASGRRDSRSARTDTPEAEAIILQSRQTGADQTPTSWREPTVVASTYKDVTTSAARRIGSEAGQALDLVPPTSPIVASIEIDEEKRKVPTSQINETQEDAQASADSVDTPLSFVRADSLAPSVAPSVAPSFTGSQASQSSQMSAFSISAFKGVMSKFVEQIKEFVKGGSQQGTQETAQQMADEANRTVEKLAKVARKNRAG